MLIEKIFPLTGKKKIAISGETRPAPLQRKGRPSYFRLLVLGLYAKPYLTVDEQIALVESRGMLIPDRAKAEEYLSRIGYYRLSAFWYPFRETAVAPDGATTTLNSFKPGTSFSTAIELYAFDKTLRLQLLDMLERIEISVRTSLALTLGKHDPWAHRQPHLLDGRFTGSGKHAGWLGKLDDKAQASKEEFADHFRSKYPASPMPAWIAVELLDFGPLSHFLAGLRWADITGMSANYRVPRNDLFRSWIRALSGVRNVCAHHGRLWNRPLVDQPRLPKLGEVPLLDHLLSSPYQNRRLYAACAIARYLLLSVNPRTKWPSRLRAHLATFPVNPHGISIATSGFPPGWDQLPLWQ